MTDDGWFLTSERLPPRFQNVVGIIENGHGVQRAMTVYLDRDGMRPIHGEAKIHEGERVVRWQWFPFVRPGDMTVGGG